MYTTYHLSSAEELNSDILDAIKTTFKSKPITIIVEEDEDFGLTKEMKKTLDNRLMEDNEQYLSADESIKKL
ncbi:MAG: hypothetical protein KJ712_03040, partial [Bacteroidetes bacterium]|nr:hypothetical protein [Bacteroidota bacterium]